jgi:hypothetical protein
MLAATTSSDFGPEQMELDSFNPHHGFNGL